MAKRPTTTPPDVSPQARACSKDWCVALGEPGRDECAVHVRGLVQLPLKAPERLRPWADRPAGWYRPPPGVRWPWREHPHWTEAYR